MNLENYLSLLVLVLYMHLHTPIYIHACFYYD